MTGLSPKIDLVAWARQVLPGVGAPTTSNNLVLMVAWARQEGGHNANTRAYNPLNSTLKEPGATYGGQQGNIASYPSYAVGLAATISNLGEPRYDGIVAALKASDDPGHVADLIGMSLWGTSGAGIRKNIPDARASVAAAGGGGVVGPGGVPVAQPAIPIIAGTDITPLVTAADNIPGDAAAAAALLASYTSLSYGPGHDPITIANEPADPDVLAALNAAHLSLSTTEVTELTLTYEDPALANITGGAAGTIGTPVTYGPLRLIIEAAEYNTGAGGAGGITATCRPIGANTLRALKGPQTFTNLSPTAFVALAATRAGLDVVAQPSAVRPSIVVAAAPSTGGQPETVWAALGRLATELGYLMFEAAGVLFFGQPSWLIKVLPPLALTWSWSDRALVETNDAGQVISRPRPAVGPIVTQPIVRFATDDNGNTTKELTVTVLPEFLGSKWTTGAKLTLTGHSPVTDGDYLITGIDVDLATPESPATITAAVTPDPIPSVNTSTAAATGDDNIPGSGPVTLQPPAAGLLHVGPGNTWIHPTNGHGTDERNYGQVRRASAGVPAHTHAGDDIAVPVGTPLLAVTDGAVVSAGTHSGYGYAVYMTTSAGLEIRYGHLSRFAPGLEDEPGQAKETPVKAGQVLGWSGGQPGTPGAGDATGPHLHFEVRQSGHAISPYPYIDRDPTA